MALAMAPSCIFDPKEEVIPPPPIDVDWPDMTSRDDVVKTVVLAYKYPKYGESVSKYNAILHSEYFFKLAEGDVGVGESPIITRAQDIVVTEWIFDNQSMLELTIPETGTWDVFEEMDGEPCVNCWESTREYRIRVQFGDDETTYQSPAGSAFVTIIVSPDESDPGKWVLRAMYDILTN
jgi:hypothetical protein